MIKDELTERIRAAFSVEPLPEEYWRDGVDLSGDIPEELSARIVRRPWNEISITDWTMTGAHASIARGYLNANAFRYYLPSLLLVGLHEIGYIDWALECLLPAGRRRKNDQRMVADVLCRVHARTTRCRKAIFGFCWLVARRSR